MSRKRILFIDSDDGFVREVADAAQQQGFEALVTGSSTDGVERARQDRPDLIVVNVELAPTNGWSVCTKLKKDDDLKDIPVILTSSLSTPDTFEKHKKLKTRADEYLLKPYESNELIQLASTLIGSPDPSDLTVSAGDEDVVVEDETLTSGDFDMAGLDEEIPVLEDEPFAGGLEASLDDLTAEGLDSPIDPLASVTEGPEGGETDALADLSADFGDLGDLGAEVSVAPSAAASDDFASFEDSFASLASSDETSATGLPEASLDPAPFDEFNAASLTGDIPEASLSPLSEALNPAFAQEALLSTDGASPFSAEEFSFDEAPLEVNTETETPAVATTLAPSDASTDVSDFAAEFDAATAAFGNGTLGTSDDFGSVDSLGSSLGGFEDSARTAELEARIAELEAEVEGYRATETGHDQELERLRHENTQRSRESQELRDQLRDREKTIFDLKESESKTAHELSKARDENTRREAAMKVFTQKAEQISMQAKRLERDLIAAREELKTTAPLKARVAELEAAHKEVETKTTTLQQQLETAQSELAAAQQQVAETKAALEAAEQERDSLRTQLEESKTALQSASDEKAALAEQLTALQERATQLTTQTQAANERAVRAREALRLAVEHLGSESESSAA